jgi:hypothetical protein
MCVQHGDVLITKPRTFRESMFVFSHYYPIYFILPLHLSILFVPVYDLYSLK